MPRELARIILFLGILVLIIVGCIIALQDYHSTHGVVDLGGNTAYVPDGETLLIYSIVLKYGYEVTVDGNQITIHSLDDTIINVCSPDCTVAYRNWPDAWIFEKVEGGVKIIYPNTFHFVD